MIRLIITLMSFSMMGFAQNNFLQREDVKLSKPYISVSEVFFEKNATMTIADVEEGVQVFWVYNDVATAEYTEPKQFRNSFKISATAMGAGYIQSDESVVQAIKLPLHSVKEIESDRLPSEKYSKGGLDILIDRKKGNENFNEGWLGYEGDTVSYSLSIEKRSVYMVNVCALRMQNSWIFSPAKVEVYHDGELLAATIVYESSEQKEDGLEIITIPIEHLTIDHLEVRVISLKSIPPWHSGAASKPWIFIDEILIY